MVMNMYQVNSDMNIQDLLWLDDASVWVKAVKKRFIDSVNEYENVRVKWFVKNKVDGCWYNKCITLNITQFLNTRDDLKWHCVDWSKSDQEQNVGRANGKSTFMELHIIDWVQESSGQVLEDQIKNDDQEVFCIKVFRVKIPEGQKLNIKMQELKVESLQLWDIHLEGNAFANINRSSMNESLDIFHIRVRLDKNAICKINLNAVSKEGCVFSHCVDLKINKEATNASIDQKVKVLHLGGAVFVRPWLKIQHDEVKANHGIAIGGLDEHVLMYLASRGLTKEEAEHFLIEGHLDLGEVE